MLDCNHNSGPAVLSPHNNAVIQANAASLPQSRGTFGPGVLIQRILRYT